MALYLISCVGVEHDLPYLEHFVRHYKSLGVEPDSFHLLMHAKDPASPRLEEAKAILARHDITGIPWIEPNYSSVEMWQQRQNLQKRIAKPEDWVISADIDELHEYPAPLEDIIAWCEREGHEIVQGPFIDRLSADGQLVDVPGPDRRLEDVFPVQAELRHHIGGYTTNVNLAGSVNLMLVRGDVLLGNGGHSPEIGYQNRRYALGGILWRFNRLAEPKFLFSIPFLVHHYKWTTGLLEHSVKRLEAEAMTPADREYTSKLVAFFKSAEGIPVDALATRDPARDQPDDWQAKVRELRRSYAFMRPMIDAKRAFRKVVRIGRKAIGK